MSKSYRDVLESRGIKPCLVERTQKEAGSIEMVWDRKTRSYVAHVHEGETVRPKLELVKRRAA